MSDDEIIAVVQARKNGATIQCRSLPGGFWGAWTSAEWDFVNYEYRVRREPLEGWIDPQDIYGAPIPSAHFIRVREVLE